MISRLSYFWQSLHLSCVSTIRKIVAIGFLFNNNSTVEKPNTITRENIVANIANKFLFEIEDYVFLNMTKKVHSRFVA